MTVAAVRACSYSQAAHPQLKGPALQCVLAMAPLFPEAVAAAGGLVEPLKILQTWPNEQLVQFSLHTLAHCRRQLEPEQLLPVLVKVRLFAVSFVHTFSLSLSLSL
jgi:hypothetical protein